MTEFVVEEAVLIWLGDLGYAVAASPRIRLTVCSQPQFIVAGSGEARCFDAVRLNEIGGTAFKAKLKGNRKECGCYEARDIGEYDTCPHDCVYCYTATLRVFPQNSNGAQRKSENSHGHSEKLVASLDNSKADGRVISDNKTERESSHSEYLR